MEHELKIDPLVFPWVASNEKRLEMRRDDRNPPFGVGDILKLRQTAFSGAQMAQGSALLYTGQECKRVVTHCLRGEQYGVAEGYVAMSIRPLHWHEVHNSTWSRLENN